MTPVIHNWSINTAPWFLGKTDDVLNPVPLPISGALEWMSVIITESEAETDALDTSSSAALERMAEVSDMACLFQGAPLERTLQIIVVNFIEECRSW